MDNLSLYQFGAPWNAWSLPPYFRGIQNTHGFVIVWLVFIVLLEVNGFTHCIHTYSCLSINTLRSRQNGRHFPDDIFKCIFLNESIWNSIEISLKFVPKGPINNIPALVQIMAWRRPGDKPLSEPLLVCLLTHICVTRPQWVKWQGNSVYTSWDGLYEGDALIIE